MKKILPLFIIAHFGFIQYSCAQPLHQKRKFTRQDTLQGSITPEREWWDVVSYTIGVAPDFQKKTIEGKNEIQFKVLKEGSRMQIDLQQPMQISRAYTANGNLQFTRDENVYYINFPKPLKAGTIETITIVFNGKPREANNPPWDGGWIWKRDEKGNPWMSVACQGLGASAWYPCKDHQSDEPDSATMNIAVPDTLVAIANGKLQSKISHSKGMMTYKWAVTNPINNYNLVPYIGKYTNFSETYQGEKGPLTCSYWVLDYNLQAAKKQFVQASQTLKALEHWFGPYPFYEDDFKLVESPHLGMEHQSAIAYGNKFQNGYLGTDLSETGWGLKWDYIIVHESGHEWFGNNITAKDIADMWIQEGFTDYCEALFTEYYYGKDAANAYVKGLQRNIKNDRPVIGPYGVNQEGSGDMYYKGANLIHTIRQVIDNDALFRTILRGLNKEYYHQTVTTKQVEDYISKQSGKNLSKIFDQYLRDNRIPTLEIDNGQYRWINCIDGFDLPLRLADNSWIYPTTSWKKLDGKQNTSKVAVNPNFYIAVKQ